TNCCASKRSSARWPSTSGAPPSRRGSRVAERANSRANKKRKKKAARRHAGTVRAAAASVVLVGLLFAFVYPTRTFLDQRQATTKARTQLELLRSENKRLAREAKRLNGNAEIERLARGYGLVKPGERPFVIIPAPTSPAPTSPPAATG